MIIKRAEQCASYFTLSCVKLNEFIHCHFCSWPREYISWNSYRSVLRGQSRNGMQCSRGFPHTTPWELIGLSFIEKPYLRISLNLNLLQRNFHAYQLKMCEMCKLQVKYKLKWKWNVNISLLFNLHFRWNSWNAWNQRPLPDIQFL